MQDDRAARIDEFLGRYQREIDYFQELSRRCAQRCELLLQQNGIRAIVTFRAKRLEALRDKLLARVADRDYTSVQAIYDDIVDLAGVRIALYFPGNQAGVAKLIESAFQVVERRDFPRSDEVVPGDYPRRFAGYNATHFRVRLRASDLPEDQGRYAGAAIEIQVASVLMHAWAEVNHDLAYKPTTGELSTEEYAILDELNGLVLTGEIALERLQRAVDERISRQRAPFRNHYELADYLHDFVRSRDPGQKDEPRMGRADVLLRFLELAGLNSLEELARFLEEVSFDGNEADRGPGDRRDSGE